MATFLQTLFGVRFDRGIGENNEDHPKMKMKKASRGEAWPIKGLLFCHCCRLQ